MRREKLFYISSILFLLASVACAPQPKTSTLLREISAPPPLIEKIILQEGKVDYILLHDEGYSWRLIFLCANKVYNLVADAENKPILVSCHPILGSEVEEKIPPLDRIKIWRCWEEKIQAEQTKLAQAKEIIIQERKGVEKEIAHLWAEKERLEKVIIEEALKVGQQRIMAEEKRVAEREAQLKQEEEQRRKIVKIEEEKKVRYYRSRERDRDEDKEKDKEVSPPLRVTETGIFLVMKDSPVYEKPKRSARVQTRAKKYDLFNVLNSTRDETGAQWHQIFLGERVSSKKVKKVGWSPEEKSFWLKHRLLAWVYPGDINKINNLKPLKLPAEELHYTGKKTSLADKPHLFEVTYEVTTEFIEKVYGWIEDQNGIRRADKNIEEMMELMKSLASTLWPLRIQNDILRGYIRVGFTPEQVILAWGKPNHINKTRTFVGVHEQWVYGEKPFPKAYVYFENGLVKNWEFFRR